MLAVPGHKGLLGPLGTGALYVKDGIDIYPVTEGGTGTASKELIQPIDFPEGFEAGQMEGREPPEDFQPGEMPEGMEFPGGMEMNGEAGEPSEEFYMQDKVNFFSGLTIA